MEELEMTNQHTEKSMETEEDKKPKRIKESH